MKTVVLLSGGIDSITLAEREYREERLVGTVFVNMQQPSALAESYKALQFHLRTKVPHRVVHLSGVDLGAMIGAVGASIVPSRNLMLLSIASNAASSLGADALLIGASRNDDKDYIDCRQESLHMASKAFVAMGGIPIYAPFVAKDKSEIIQMAVEFGLSPKDAWSCYRKGPMSCGICASCKEAELAWNVVS